MKLSSVVYASVLALTAATFVVDGAMADKTRLNSYRFDSGQMAAAQACTKAGGTVATDLRARETKDLRANGTNICTLPSTKYAGCYNSCEACNGEAGEYGYACFMIASGKCCAIK
jgi:hypothetical protein